MLEGINDINWEQIGYGESLYPENIPHIVHTLASGESKIISKTLDELYFEMTMYGDKYPSRVTIVVLPFLFEILALDNILLKAELLEILADLLENSIDWLQSNPYGETTSHGKQLIKFVSALQIHVPSLITLKESEITEVSFMATKILSFYTNGGKELIDERQV